MKYIARLIALAAILLGTIMPAEAFDNGLLRALVPDIFGFVAITLTLLVIGIFVRRFVALAGLVWFVLALVFLWHVFTLSWSLRIPRSDVDATGVYQQMDSHVQGSH